MTHDPYQMYAAFGLQSALNNPFSSPFTTAMQAAQLNPGAGIYNALTGNAGAQQMGYPGYGATPQQLGPLAYGGIVTQQLPVPGAFSPLNNPQINAQFGNPQFGAPQFSNPWQNPYAANVGQNPLAVAGWQNPYSVLQNPILQNALQNPAFQSPVLQNPFLNPQINPLFAQAAAMQSYGPYGQPFSHIGHGAHGTGQLAPQTWVGQGQIHPSVLQSVARAIQSQGFNPWGGF